ncbi:MAG TPA: adenylate/guanylate cyclase domain-containing protein, partial [Chromatiales bacterium]|nr:adenylate/guanylate cyclase domain-containing protein [Chromatiales bacterium]
MRTCPICQAKNTPERRHCVGCGEALSLVCPDCRFENPPRANFCAGCGKVLHAPGTAPLREAVQAQRRQVTVLFADLVGSTALATQLDPEDLHALIHRYQRVCAEVVTRYGGHVAQYLGDGVLAYFGYPRAHEDDAARATRAGLEIAGRLAAGPLSPAHPQVSARVGIATGTVVVDEHPRPGT